MNESCDIREEAGLCRCRTCGAAWHGPREAWPCDAVGPVGGLVGAALDLVRPRGFLGLILWAGIVCGAFAAALALLLYAADRALRAGLTLIGG